MKIDYIIVQAGGKGTRLEYLTANKPKALVPVENFPMIFHLFRTFPDKKYIVIGDYKKDVFKKYLRCFADVEYIFVEADGEGTCGGLQQALRFIPANTPFMYVWSDLILAENFNIPMGVGNYIGISCDFECRWSYLNDGLYEEKRSFGNGIAGLFLFEDRAVIADVPRTGEFVGYLQKKGVVFRRLELHRTREFGLLSEYNKLPTEKCRPFNSIKVENGHLIKMAIDEQGKRLASMEIAWYLKAQELDYTHMPYVYGYEPLDMQLIKGRNIYEYGSEMTEDEKAKLLCQLVRSLAELHSLVEAECDMFSVQEAYAGKTFARLGNIRDLVPFADEKYIVINGRKCRNVFFCREELERQIMSFPYGNFKFIHGDCTFSNIMLTEEGELVLIDPRGYFGHTKLYGDEDYDWAKLYYSLKGNYDQFNLKRFRLSIGEGKVEVAIESNGFEEVADDIFDLLPQLNKKKIKLLHAIIWLSLTTYAWQDYDSICGAFYMGCYYLEEAFHD